MERETEAYLNDVRALSGLENAILTGICVHRRTMTAEFFLVTDKTYSASAKEGAKNAAVKYLPPAFKPEVHIEKRVPDAEMIRGKIAAFLKARFPAAAAFVKDEDIEAEMLPSGSGARFRFDVASGDKDVFSSGKILDEVSAYLSGIYCGSFYGDVRLVERERETFDPDEIPAAAEEEEIARAPRVFPVTGFRRLDGADVLPKYATYIADAVGESEDMTVCGAITFIQEREYTKKNEKTGEETQKTRFSLAVSDGTGSLRTTYFPKKATLEKVRALKVGDWVVLSGANESYGGGISFTAKRINYGRPPENFVPEARKGKPVPKAYHAVFPEPYVDYTQADLFETSEAPAALRGKSVVCFDLETTGLNSQPAMGRMDRIIEIGAVKIVDGKIAEKFSTFVACPTRLPPEIVKLTGIHDEDLAGAPPIEKVIADFYKFCDGCALAGHNSIQFDCRFIRYYGEESGYMFDQPQYDTLPLAQEVLRGEGLSNYKLNTLADYYGFTFNHHRAFDDALTTAKIFMELVRKKGSLPLA